MIVEFVMGLSLLLSGYLALTAMGVTSRRVLAGFSVIVGAAIHILLGSMQAIASLQTFPVATILLSVLLPTIALLVRNRVGRAVRVNVPTLVLSAVAVSLVVATFSIAERINFHVDTFEYLSIGLVLTSGTFLEGVSIFQLEKRMLALPVLHAPSSLVNENYLSALTPLLAVACLVALGTIIHAGLRPRFAHGAWPLTVALLACFLLLSINRFVFHAFYLNGHLLFATLLLGLVGVSWLARRRSAVLEGVNVTAVQAVLVSAFILTRPEAGLVAVLALAPALLDASRSLRARSWLLIAMGSTMTVWQVFLIIIAYAVGSEATRPMLGMLALAVLLFVAIPVLHWHWLSAESSRLLVVAELGLWAALVVLALRRPTVFLESAYATWQNIISDGGSWGPAFVLLLIIGVIVVTVVRTQKRIDVRFTLTTFVPLVYILAFLRDAAYRVAEADSLNRMVIQLVPVLILLIASAADPDSRLFWRREGDAQKGSDALDPQSARSP